MTIAENFNTTGGGGPGGQNALGPGVIRSASGNNILTGTLTNIGGGGFSTYTVDAGSTLDLAGIINHDPTLSRVLTVGGAGNGTISGKMLNSGTAGNTLGLDKQGAGTWTVSGTQNNYSGPTTVNGAGTLRVTGSIATSSGVTVNTGTFDAAATQSVKAMTVNANGTTLITAGLLTVGNNLTATPLVNNGKIDLTSRGLIVDTSPGNDAAALATIRSQIITGFHESAPGVGDGDWLGATGITSSTAAADASAKGVGYALASDILGPTGGTFMGATVDGDAVLTRYTLLGDATLDGQVNFADLVQLAQNYNVVDGARTWFTGDFTYDGNTNFADLVKLAQNYNTALPTEPIPGASADFQADLAAAFASVPEPGALGLIGLAACGLAGRRRRRGSAR
jgi:autotransporter-associated beta strand protein